MRTSALVAGLAVALLPLTACSDGDDTVSTSSTGAASAPSATGSPTAGSSPTGPADADEPSGGEPAFRSDASPDTVDAEREGNGLTLVDVRVGEHEGYDRLVLELDGEGTVGWDVRYEDDPRTDGEGKPVELAGDATLHVRLDGLGYPFETGIEEYDGERRMSPSLPAVQEVQVGGVFEGYLDAFLGVDRERPFRVFRLDDPQRVVVDVASGG